MISPLQAVKITHTLFWAFFASCIVAIPLADWAGRLDLALRLIGIVAIEVMVLVLNAWKCPLTAIAARYTDDRQDNFDIYLPVWLARYNKLIFGSIYAIGVLFTLAQWRGWLG